MAVLFPLYLSAAVAFASPYVQSLPVSPSPQILSRRHLPIRACEDTTVSSEQGELLGEDVVGQPAGSGMKVAPTMVQTLRGGAAGAASAAPKLIVASVLELRS